MKRSFKNYIYSVHRQTQIASHSLQLDFSASASSIASNNTSFDQCIGNPDLILKASRILSRRFGMSIPVKQCRLDTCSRNIPVTTSPAPLSRMKTDKMITFVIEISATFSREQIQVNIVRELLLA